jgi:hypothetical protein
MILRRNEVLEFLHCVHLLSVASSRNRASNVSRTMAETGSALISASFRSRSSVVGLSRTRNAGHSETRLAIDVHHLSRHRRWREKSHKDYAQRQAISNLCHYDRYYHSMLWSIGFQVKRSWHEVVDNCYLGSALGGNGPNRRARITVLALLLVRSPETALRRFYGSS